MDVLFKKLDWKDLTSGGFVWKFLGLWDGSPSQELGLTRGKWAFREGPWGPRAVKLSPQELNRRR